MFKKIGIFLTQMGEQLLMDKGTLLIDEGILTLAEYHVLDSWETTRDDEEQVRKKIDVGKVIESLVRKRFLFKKKYLNEAGKY